MRDACDVTTVHGYDAVIVGSAIYNTRWRSDTVRVVGLPNDGGAEPAAYGKWEPFARDWLRSL